MGKFIFSLILLLIIVGAIMSVPKLRSLLINILGMSSNDQKPVIKSYDEMVAAAIESKKKAIEGEKDPQPAKLDVTKEKKAYTRAKRMKEANLLNKISQAEDELEKAQETYQAAVLNSEKETMINEWVSLQTSIHTVEQYKKHYESLFGEFPVD